MNMMWRLMDILRHRETIGAGRTARVLGAVTAAALALFATTAEAGSRTIVVPRDFATIQAAIDAAAPGATINVGSGTYTEQLVIVKDLTLHGAGALATFVKSPASLAPYAVTVGGTPLSAIVRVAKGAHVRISGLTVSGPGPCGIVSGVSVLQAADLQLTDSRVSDIVPAATSCTDAQGYGVQFGVYERAIIDGQQGTSASGRVSNVVVDTFLSGGLIAVAPLPPYGTAITKVAFTNNLIVAGVSQYPSAPNGIWARVNATAQVTGNTVLGGGCTYAECGPDPTTQIQSAGIVIESAIPGSTVADNHVSDADIGIYDIFSPDFGKISGNTVTDNRYFGIAIQDGDGETRNNTIRGGQVGIGVIADAVDTVGILRGDSISGTTLAPVQEIDCCGATAAAIVK